MRPLLSFGNLKKVDALKYLCDILIALFSRNEVYSSKDNLLGTFPYALQADAIVKNSLSVEEWKNRA